MKILVTGGAGFIGSHLIDKLLLEDFKIICLDNFDNSSSIEKKNNINKHLKSQNYELVKGDISDKLLVEEVFSIFKPQIVINLAARSGINSSKDEPIDFYNTNILGTLNLLESMKINKPIKFIQASSGAVYGFNNKSKYSENDPTSTPLSPYAATKVATEALCYSYCHLFKINTTILRFFSVYGSRIRPDLAIRKFVLNILQKKEIQIYGNGNSSHDYSHVSDIVTGIRKAIDYSIENFSVFNLGSSNPEKLSELIKKIESILGEKAILKYEEKPECKESITCADISKANNLLGYNPTMNLKEGLIEMIIWIKKEKIT